MLLAFYLHNVSPFIFQIGSIGPHWYGLAYVLSFVIGYRLYVWLAEKGYTQMPASQVGDFITWAAVFGVMLGGRLGWAIFYGWRDIRTHPLTLFKVWEGGMASHGGILGLVLFTLYYSRRHRLSWTSIGDSLCVVAPVGLFLVRCANFINGELFGKPASVAWAVLFPAELQGRPDVWPRLGVNDAESLNAFIVEARHNPELANRLREVIVPRHPSQLYEAFLEGVVLFTVLWVLRTRFRVPRGVITGVFFILYALLRIVGELFREPDPAWSVGAISAGQFLSFFLIFLGVAFIVWGYRTKQYERVFDSEHAGG